MVFQVVATHPYVREDECGLLTVGGVQVVATHPYVREDECGLLTVDGVSGCSNPPVCQGR